MPDLEADLFNLAMSEQAQPLMDAVKKHINTQSQDTRLK